MSHREIKWANAIKTMTPIDLLNTVLPQTVNLENKTKQNITSAKQSTIKQGMFVCENAWHPIQICWWEGFKLFQIMWPCCSAFLWEILSALNFSLMLCHILWPVSDSRLSSTSSFTGVLLMCTITLKGKVFGVELIFGGLFSLSSNHKWLS